MKSLTKRQREAALEVLLYWREQGVPNDITTGEAWRLTGGLVGKHRATGHLTRATTAARYARKGGTLADARAMNEGN